MLVKEVISSRKIKVCGWIFESNIDENAIKNFHFMSHKTMSKLLIEILQPAIDVLYQTLIVKNAIHQWKTIEGAMLYG